MAKSKLAKVNEKIAEGVTTGFKKISDGVVDGYKNIENAVTEGYTKIEDKFVDAYLTKDGETVDEAKKRLKNETKYSNNTAKSYGFAVFFCKNLTIRILCGIISKIIHLLVKCLGHK